MAEDVRAVLEGIVYGDDPKITPADRLRAAELLEHAGGEEPELRTVVRSMSDAEVDGEWDALFALEVPELLRDNAAEMPRTAGALRRLVEERAHELAREIADADRIDREVEERAHELAQRYARELARAALVQPVVEHPDVEGGALPAAPAPRALPPGVDLNAGWRRRGGRDWRNWPRG